MLHYTMITHVAILLCLQSILLLTHCGENVSIMWAWLTRVNLNTMDDVPNWFPEHVYLIKQVTTYAIMMMTFWITVIYSQNRKRLVDQPARTGHALAFDDRLIEAIERLAAAVERSTDSAKMN